MQGSQLVFDPLYSETTSQPNQVKQFLSESIRSNLDIHNTCKTPPHTQLFNGPLRPPSSAVFAPLHDEWTHYVLHLCPQETPLSEGLGQ